MQVWEIWKTEPVYETKTVTEEIPVYKTVPVYEKQTVPVWSVRQKEVTEYVTEPIYKEVTTPVYKNVTYYRSKTCKTTTGDPDYKWSYSNKDTDLLSKGYVLTGKTKQV